VVDDMSSPETPDSVTQPMMPIVVMIIKDLTNQKSIPGKMKSLPAHNVDPCISYNRIEKLINREEQ